MIGQAMKACMFALGLVMAVHAPPTRAGDAGQSAKPARVRAKPQIVRGQFANNIQQFPWQVSMGFIRDFPGGSTYFHLCGASIIAPRVILTAAHCMYWGKGAPREGQQMLPSEITIFSGKSTLPPSGFARSTLDWRFTEVDSIAVHEQFTREANGALLNDIALIFTKDSFPLVSLPLNASAPVQLDKTGTSLAGDLFIAGWGSTAYNGPSSAALLYTTIRQLAGCSLETTTRFCTGFGPNNSAPCEGDSGGPLVAQYVAPANGAPATAVQVGIDSTGASCGSPTVFTRVSAFSWWIAQQRAAFYLRARSLFDIVLPNGKTPGHDADLHTRWVFKQPVVIGPGDRQMDRFGASIQGADDIVLPFDGCYYGGDGPREPLKVVCPARARRLNETELAAIIGFAEILDPSVIKDRIDCIAGVYFYALCKRYPENMFVNDPNVQFDNARYYIVTEAPHAGSSPAIFQEVTRSNL
ncbi:serine protease [Sphingomonas sp.]|uniref:serine protease n=1 Tax=Sphingomonas sp. TaxID=28214 RepID=UPI0025FF0724|nr:serine protease [Sphingomonas sp.]